MMRLGVKFIFVSRCPLSEANREDNGAGTENGTMSSSSSFRFVFELRQNNELLTDNNELLNAKNFAIPRQSPLHEAPLIMSQRLWTLQQQQSAHWHARHRVQLQSG